MKLTAGLLVKQLSKSFIQGGQNVQVLAGINQQFLPGNTYAIIGTSGSGKSTFLHLLGGLDTPTSGFVSYNGQDLALMKNNEKERFLNSSLGFVFQFHYLISELTAFENVMVKGLISGRARHEVEQEALELFDYVGLSAKKSLYPAQLSGGEQQRVAVMRALMNKPQFLLADEPTGNLDHENAQQVKELFLECHKKWAMAVVICSHDKQVYDSMEHQLYLEGGVLRV